MIKQSIQRLYASAAIAVLSLFDRDVCSVVRSLTSVSRKLDRLIEHSEAVADSAIQAACASYVRLDAVRNSENVFRRKADARADKALATMNRAKRVRERISALLD